MLPGESPVQSTEELATWLRWRQERHPGSRIGASRGSAGFFGTGAIPPGRIRLLSQRRSDRQMSWVSSQGPGTVSLPGLGSAGSEGARWLLTA